MPTLTGLAPDPRQPGYRLVEVDRGRFASLPEEALQILPLTVGRELAAPVLARLQELADVEAAYRASLRALARRAHARWDLRRRLVHKAHPPPAVDGALARLAGQGLLDDSRFAREYAATHAARGRGPSRLVKDLLTHGVERRLAEEAVRQALEEEGVDTHRTAHELAEKRARQLAELPVPVRRRRLLTYLLRRGFQGPWVRAIVEEVCA